MINKLYNCEEHTIKQKWMWILVVTQFLSIIYQAFIHPNLPPLFNWLSTSDSVTPLWATCIGQLLSFALFYYCAYYKPGTKLLTFSLFFFPLSMLQGFAIYSAFLWSEWLAGMVLSVDWILIIWWYVLTFKLRKINEVLQIKAIASMPGYLNAVSLLQVAASIEELNFKFSEAIQGRSRRFVKALKREYEFQKQRLLLIQSSSCKC